MSLSAPLEDGVNPMGPVRQRVNQALTNFRSKMPNLGLKLPPSSENIFKIKLTLWLPCPNIAAVLEFYRKFAAVCTKIVTSCPTCFSNPRRRWHVQCTPPTTKRVDCRHKARRRLSLLYVRKKCEERLLFLAHTGALQVRLLLLLLLNCTDYCDDFNDF